MGTYVARRLLLMLPTTFGISMILWLVMLAAPGRPGEQAQSFGEVSTNADPSKELAKGESQWLFRRQFALDRPTFWNSWTSLDDAEIRRALEDANAPIESVGPRVKREAKERLEDWGTYAVPGLARLLAANEGTPAVQDAALYWLRRGATRRMVLTQDPALLARNHAWAIENAEVERLKWSPADPPERRKDVVEKWRAWTARNADRWTWSGLEKLKIAVTDTQFGTYWSHLLRLDFGTSHTYKRPVLDLIAERLPVTFTLSFVSLILIYVLAIPLGIFSAVKPYGVTDRTLTVGLFLLYSLPSFFVGTVLLRSLTIGDPFAWFPTSAFHSAAAESWNTWDRLNDTLWHITLPLVVMTYAGLAGLSRFARTGMLDVIRSDYVRTARAKGLSESVVIFRHAARNGMMPIVTLLGSFLPSLVGGSIVVEFIFNINGMGLLTIEAINNRDYNIVVGEALIVAVLTQVGILLSDLLYAMLDPRISFA